MGRGQAPGKVILVGEHFVVHGAPAIALPLLGRGIEVVVERVSGPWDVLPGTEAHLRRLLIALEEDAEALRLSVRSELPIGAGLGGSAALAVALVKALDDSGALTTAEVRECAHRLEKLAHGTPSGIDDTVAAYGRPVWFQRESRSEVLEVEPCRVWVGLTAQRTSTREAVAHVRGLSEARPRWFGERLAEATVQVEHALQALRDADWSTLGRVMAAHHGLLQSLEVSTAALDTLVQSALDAGAFGAKLTGGGLGGAAIAICPPEIDLTDVWLSAGATEVIAP
ncbi:MAG: mevalonate kinase [Myxococcota bacterium]